MILGIDASNIRRGGGLTHLMEFIRNVSLGSCDHAYLWAPGSTLDAIPNRSWLTKIELPDDYRGIRRLFWQAMNLRIEAERLGCTVMFVPGSSYAGNFRPFVTISQNLLPFQTRELLRYGLSLMTLKMLALRSVQAFTFKRADGVIFLTEFARDTVEDVLGTKLNNSTIIHHGIGARFFTNGPYSGRRCHERKCEAKNILYVSTVDVYKHQWTVVEAIAKLRNEGFSVSLTLVGPSYAPALRKLRKVMAHCDPKNEWVNFIGSTSYDDLPALYRAADIGLFASTCENLPIILLEMMASGTAICSSASGPMPEVLGDGGIYFDATEPSSIANAVRGYLVDDDLCAAKRSIARQRAADFTWESAAQLTLTFIRAVSR